MIKPTNIANEKHAAEIMDRALHIQSAAILSIVIAQGLAGILAYKSFGLIWGIAALFPPIAPGMIAYWYGRKLQDAATGYKSGKNSAPKPSPEPRESPPKTAP